MIVAALVAALGASLVFLYVKGADTRAEERFDTVEVLKATAVIEPGETIEDAQANGKLAQSPVTTDALLSGYQTTTEGLTGMVALTTLYPGEQIVSNKFGATASAESSLQIPDGKLAISVNLTDPARVAGFVNPGSEVSVFMNGTDNTTGDPYTRMLLTRVTVLGVGSTTPVSTTTTDESGASTTEQLPRTLLTLALDQDQAQRVLYSTSNGELAFALLTDKSSVKAGAPITFDNLFK